jgi:hypothetical protein
MAWDRAPNFEALSLPEAINARTRCSESPNSAAASLVVSSVAI